MTSKAKAKAKDHIEPTGGEVVIFHAPGSRTPAGIPARDLTGADLARIAYVRAHKAIDWETRDADGNPPPLPARPTPTELQALADELLEHGSFRRTPPPEEQVAAAAAAADEANTEPAPPAETPEA